VSDSADRAERRFKLFRDVALFVTGASLLVYETVTKEGVERPSLLLIFAAMMGLPAFLRKDESRG
jgi:uncharacterized membrane protein YobD (UPF0266 family)